MGRLAPGSIPGSLGKPSIDRWMVCSRARRFHQTSLTAFSLCLCCRECFVGCSGGGQSASSWCVYYSLLCGSWRSTLPVNRSDRLLKWETWFYQIRAGVLPVLEVRKLDLLRLYPCETCQKRSAECMVVTETAGLSGRSSLIPESLRKIRLYGAAENN